MQDATEISSISSNDNSCHYDYLKKLIIDDNYDQFCSAIAELDDINVDVSTNDDRDFGDLIFVAIEFVMAFRDFRYLKIMTEHKSIDINTTNNLDDECPLLYTFTVHECASEYLYLEGEEDHDRMTPYSSERMFELANFLLNIPGIDPTVKNVHGSDTIFYCISSGYNDFMKKIVDYNETALLSKYHDCDFDISISSLMEAITSENEFAVNFILSSKYGRKIFVESIEQYNKYYLQKDYISHSQKIMNMMENFFNKERLCEVYLWLSIEPTEEHKNKKQKVSEDSFFKPDFDDRYFDINLLKIVYGFL